MELSISILLENFTENWKKSKELLEISKDYEGKDVQITIYESCVVLICANIESGIKQIAKNWISDYNTFVGSSRANNSIMKSVQDSFYAEEKQNNGYREKIKNLHITNNLPIDVHCISCVLKNPKPETFTKFFKKVGEKKFLERISSKELSELFSSNSDEREPVKEIIFQKINLLKDNPIDPLKELLPTLDSDYTTSDSWKLILEEIMKARNKIAHGNEDQITLNEKQIENFIEKAEFFQYLTILNLYQIFFDDYNKP